MPLVEQFLSDGLEIVDFPVENEPEGPVFVAHRLTGILGKIDDAQAAMGQADIPLPGNRFDLQAFVVRAPVDDRIGHSPYRGRKP